MIDSASTLKYLLCVERAARFLNAFLFTSSMERIGDGAEAIIYKKEEIVVKDRVSKRYRLAEIDQKLRKTRTRQEASILKKLEGISFPSPRIKEMDDKEMLLHMEHIDGPQVKEVLDSSKERDALASEIGKLIAVLHKQDIVHGDLTTSNMILHDSHVYFIDFGLGFFSTKIEDKAVDLHLLKRALDSKHPLIAKDIFQKAIEAYQRELGDKAADEIFTRLEQVEKRGRYQKAKKLRKTES